MEIWRAHRDGDVGAAVAAAAEALAGGAVVAVPTETFYGLAADVRRPEALARVLTLKGRPTGQPLLLLVEDLAQASRHAASLPDDAERLAAAFWPGPLTLVLPAAAGLPREVVSESGGVAVRRSSHPLVGAVVAALGAPVTGTSANRSGEPAVAEPERLRVPGVDALLDGGPTPGGEPSTLVDLTGERPRLLRAGAIPRAALAEIVGERLV